MPDHFPDLDNDELVDWRRVVETDLRWTGILVGNGASRAVWDAFSYPSLFERASSNAVNDPLLPPDEALFNAFGTRNFERVLGSLKTAGSVATALGESDAEIRVRYAHIQRALFEAVGSVHVPWDRAAGDTLLTIRRALRAYRAVFSTNYDLLIYWALMHEDDGAGFKDFFWSGADAHSFDPSDTGVSSNATRVYYLHGGIHLRSKVEGGTRKHVSDLGALLDDFETAFDADDVPLLISEGTSADKLDAIRRSDYLSFAYGRLAEHTGGLVIFGQSLSDEDQHLVDVLNSWRPPWREPVIAISIQRTVVADEVRWAKLYYAHRLPHADLLFFDPDTHPLGQPNVRPAN